MSSTPQTAPFSFGNDKFDLLLNSLCSVWKKTTTGTTSYGQPIETYVQLADDVKCYVEQTSGKELSVPPAPASETSLAIETFNIFIRPLSVDDPPVRLNNHHYLQVKKTGEITLDANDPSAVLYNITDVDDPGLAGHHYEVSATVLRP